MTTGREEVGSEASTRFGRAAAAALATAAFLLGAAVALADPGPPPPPPPPPSTGGGSTSPTTPTTPSDNTPPKRARDLKVAAPAPGRIVLTWTLVGQADVAHVIVARGPAGHCPVTPLAGTQIGGVNPRTTQVDKTEHDTTGYCYAVFTLDVAGNWASPITHLARNNGDTTAPAAATGMTARFGQGGAVRLTWVNPPDAARDVVVRGPGSTCPQFPADGTRIPTHGAQQSVVDASVPSTGSYCYGVFVFDQAGNRSFPTTTTVAPAATPPSSGAAQPPDQQGSSGSSLPDVVGIVGGGAIVLAGLGYVSLRLVRREWEWHARTGYGVRDLMSVDVRDYDRTALVIPAIIGVCIAGAIVVLLISL